MFSPPQANATVLVADDEEAYRGLFTQLLTDEGYNVLCANDGEEALQHIANNPIDLVLLDVMMPRKSGLAACLAVKSDPKTRLIPVVLVTGLNSADDRVQGAMCGADDFLSKPVNRQEFLARVHSLVRLKKFTDELENAEIVLGSLALSVEAKDPCTEGHCERLSHYAVALGKRLNLSEEWCVALRRGGVVHDIGKIGVPESILTKPGPLTEDEWRMMKQHPAIGERICAPLKSFGLVLPIIRHHHERLDGSGYPDGLKGEEIPFAARILQTVDIFDAITTDRPYHRARTPREAFALLRAEVKRGWRDAALVDELEAIVLTGTVKLI
jgi:putative two-component system response regulator